MTRCQIIPPYLLLRLLESQPAPTTVEAGRRTLEIDAQVRAARSAPRTEAIAPQASDEGPLSVYTAANGDDLPGRLVRAAGAGPTGDQAVDEAYAGVEATLALYSEVYGRDSFDGKGATVRSTVHYERGYDNAFWNGSQLVFGDGDGEIFQRFTKPVDVLGHELSHAVTQFTAGLTYQGQSGALNESVSDVFGSCVKQRLLGQSAAEADWLIGEGIFLPSVQGVALRSMKAPGTAYDDPRLGKDPQAATMDGYVDTTEDNGGVHTNSGIPNHAFYLAATGIGGTAWDGAGKVWYTALTSGISPDTDFAGFAAATITAARAVSAESEAAVTDAWRQVGVVPGGAAAPTAPPTAPTSTVEVVRSGGFAGVRQAGALTLGDDPRTPQVESLLAQIDLRAVAPSAPPQPDRFVYTFSVQGEQTVLGEQDLTPELHQLARLLLE